MQRHKLDICEYFVGAVPPHVIYQMESDSLRDIVMKALPSNSDHSRRRNQLAEVCLIGLVAYFEAYCKNQFAAIGNIFPEILSDFSQKREEVTLSLTTVLAFPDAINHRLGSILSENYDFGSAKIINSLFFDLLGITPFSTKEIKDFHKLLNDRNLIVHHGGIFTLKYQKQNRGKVLDIYDIHNQSLIISINDFLNWAKFIDGMVHKITTSSYKKLKTMSTISSGQEQALDWFTMSI